MISNDYEAENAAAFIWLFATKERLHLLQRMLMGEASVGDLAVAAGLRQNVTSGNLARMHLLGVVRRRRQDRHVYYRIDHFMRDTVNGLIDAAYEHATKP
jgi:DNA-binding transcriptional ArsR family regulator